MESEAETSVSSLRRTTARLAPTCVTLPPAPHSPSICSLGQAPAVDRAGVFHSHFTDEETAGN